MTAFVMEELPQSFGFNDSCHKNQAQRWEKSRDAPGLCCLFLIILEAFAEGVVHLG